MALMALIDEELAQEDMIAVTALSNTATGAAWNEGPGEGCAVGSAVDGAAVGPKVGRVVGGGDVGGMEGLGEGSVVDGGEV